MFGGRASKQPNILPFAIPHLHLYTQCTKKNIGLSSTFLTYSFKTQTLFIFPSAYLTSILLRKSSIFFWASFCFLSPSVLVGTLQIENVDFVHRYKSMFSCTCSHGLLNNPFLIICPPLFTLIHAPPHKDL